MYSSWSGKFIAQDHPTYNRSPSRDIPGGAQEIRSDTKVFLSTTYLARRTVYNRQIVLKTIFNCHLEKIIFIVSL